MPGPVGPKPLNLVQTALRVAQAVPKVVQNLPQPARQAVQDTFERVARPLVNLGANLVNGPRQGTGPVTITPPPYTDTRSADEIKAARNGTTTTALDWARLQAHNGNTGYDNYCLQFCQNAFGIHSTPARCPELSNAGGQGNAIGAFNALQQNGKIRPESGTPDRTQPLEAGSIVFFGATDKNGQDGHVCIATGRMAPDGTPEVITSGFPPDHSGVHYSSIGNLEQQSGPYLGYTTPEIAFDASTLPQDTAQASGTGGTAGTGTTLGASSKDSANAKGTVATNPAGNTPQNFNNTCGANAIMAMEASLEPELAAQLSALSPEQRAQYEAAVLTSDPSQPFQASPRGTGSTEGWGMYMMERQVAARFGGAESLVPNNRAEAVDFLTAQLDAGHPVAIALTGHWMSATDIRGEGDEREVLIHDSWTGTSAWVPESALRDTNGNWVQEYFPDAPFSPRMQGLVAATGNPVETPWRDNEQALLGEALP